MPRTWRSQIADEVRATSMQKPKWISKPCQCTAIEQDETCPVGYPSLLCGVCKGKGVVIEDAK